MSGGERILVIDDDPDFRASVRAILEGAGYAVREAADGTEGMDAARSCPPQLVLLDVMMRERTEGLFVLQEFRRTPSLSRVPVIVASSLYSEIPRFRVRDDAGFMPADLFLPKPLEPQQLLGEVQRLLAKATP